MKANRKEMMAKEDAFQESIASILTPTQQAKMVLHMMRGGMRGGMQGGMHGGMPGRSGGPGAPGAQNDGMKGGSHDAPPKAPDSDDQSDD